MLCEVQSKTLRPQIETKKILQVVEPNVWNKKRNHIILHLLGSFDSCVYSSNLVLFSLILLATLLKNPSIDGKTAQNNQGENQQDQALLDFVVTYSFWGCH